MKLQDTNTTIHQIGNIQHETSFKMKSSRKAFQILSDLYSDKPLAIVRELGCNATDSMVMAGKKDQPFHIHLPNTLEPWMTIQDFGTGITDENIYNIYATYFESTKTNSNEQIGCLGLGSKSPFCYTDNFSVTSITDGVKRIYNAFFGADGCPTIALMSTSDTSEANGIAIQIPIKPNDFYSFTEAVKKSFRFFDRKPTISGGSIDWTMEKPMFEGVGWRSYDKFGYGESFAIMGGVTYPIEIHKVDSKYHDMLRKGGLVMYFKMGEVDFTPSRESLSYCDQTIASLNSKLEYIKNDFQKRVEEMLKEKDNILDALRMMNSLHNKFAYISGMTIGKKMTWKGLDVTEPSQYIRNLIKLCGNTTTYYKTSYYRQKISESSQIDLSENSKWVWDDGIRGGITRIKLYCRENQEVKVTFFTKEAYETLVSNGFNQSKFEAVSTLPKPQKIVKTRNGTNSRVTKAKGVFNVYEIGNLDNKSWESIQIDSNVADTSIPKYYIIKDNAWDFSIDIDGKTIIDKHNLYKIMQFMEISTQDVVMVSKQNLKYMDGSLDFVDFMKDNFKPDYNMDGIATAYDNSIYTLKSYIDDNSFIALPNNSFKKYITELYNVVAKYNKYKSISMFFNNKCDGNPMEYNGNCEVTKMIVDKIGMWGIGEICMIANLLK